MGVNRRFYLLCGIGDLLLVILYPCITLVLDKKRGVMVETGKILHADCMDIMADMPDGYIDLAIVDPPYGIGETWKKNRKGEKNFNGSYKNDSAPDEKYFKELTRVSKDYIIWGANFYDFGWPTKNVIIWDKSCTWEKEHKAEAEIAITSLNHRPISIYRHTWSGGRKGSETGISIIHPHQKPVSLYRWLLQKYSVCGGIILDTHSGSGSCAIACMLEGFDFVAIEKDHDYWKASVDRFELEKSQGKLF